MVSIRSCCGTVAMFSYFTAEGRQAGRSSFRRVWVDQELCRLAPHEARIARDHSQKGVLDLLIQPVTLYDHGGTYLVPLATGVRKACDDDIGTPGHRTPPYFFCNSARYGS